MEDKSFLDVKEVYDIKQLELIGTPVFGASIGSGQLSKLIKSSYLDLSETQVRIAESYLIVCAFFPFFVIKQNTLYCLRVTTDEKM